MSLYIGTTPIRKVFVADGSGVNIESNKTVSPSTSQVVVQPDTNYDALAQVTVNPINIQPLSITSNGTYTASGGVDGYSPITVNVSGGGGGSYPWFGPNTVKDYTKTITINLKDDTSWDSWTASTTAGNILAVPTTNDFSYTYDLTLYDVWVVEIVNVNYTLKSTATKNAIPIAYSRMAIWPFYGYPNTYTDAQNNTRSAATYITNPLSALRLYYYSTSSVKTIASLSYGVYTDGYGSITTSKSGNNYTIGYKRNAISARCSSTYFATGRKGDIDSENTNIVIKVDVYKVPCGNAMFTNVLNEAISGMNASPANQ